MPDSLPLDRLTQAEAARCLESWVAFRGLACHQIESFNRFISSKLQEIVLENSEIKHAIRRNGAVFASAKCTFQKIYIRSPCVREADGTYRELSPNECRVRGLSYNISVYVNVLQEQLLNGVVTKKLFNEVLGSRGVSRASFANRAVSVSNRLDEIVQAIDLYG